MAVTKRLFDLTFVCATAFITVPICLLVGLLIWSSLGRPIFFLQTRPGLNGELFVLRKFRTMHQPKKGSFQSDKDRMTSVGQIIRALSLDELPELWNIVRGEMSLVGPRPLLPEYLSLYNPRQARRHEVTPGLTGWAQVNGRNSLSWEERFEMDVWYVENQSFWLDLKILLLTVTSVMRREGISQHGEATMRPFTGTKS